MSAAVLWLCKSDEVVVGGVENEVLASFKAAMDRLSKKQLKGKGAPQAIVVYAPMEVKMVKKLRKAAPKTPICYCAFGGIKSGQEKKLASIASVMQDAQQLASFLGGVVQVAAPPSSGAGNLQVAPISQGASRRSPRGASPQPQHRMSPKQQQQQQSANFVDNGRGLKYKLGKHLGTGNFGVAYEASDVFGQPFVVKILKTTRSKQEVEADWSKEISFMMAVHHPNIVELFDAFTHNGYYNLVLERAEGSLKDLRLREKLTENQIMDLLAQIFSGTFHLHMKNIVHRDLHAENVLFKRERDYQNGKGARYQALISDFGISAVMGRGEEKKQTFIGKNYEYAPDLITGGVSYYSDIYQIGLIAYFLVTGSNAIGPKDGPVHEVTISGLAQQRARGLNSKLGNAISELLHTDPRMRPQTCVDGWKLMYKIVYS